MQEGYAWLVIIAVIGSVVSIFYYFRPIINMYMKEPKHNEKLKASKLSIGILVFLIILSLVLGLIPGLLLNINI